MPFNYEEYQQKCDTLSNDELQKEWEGYTRQIAGSSTSTATSVLCSPLTGGVSLIGLGLSAPRIHNARKKREIIEAKLRARGATHVTRTRDIAGSVALSGAVGGLTCGLLGPGTDIVATAAADGAGLAIDHTVGGAIKKSGLKDLEMKKMQEQMHMQQQYQPYQQQFVHPGNVQMGGVPPPGLQFQRQPEQMQMPQQYQAYQQQFINPGNVLMGGAPPPGLQFQHRPGMLQESTIYPPGQQTAFQPSFQQQQWSVYQQGREIDLQPGIQHYSQMPPSQSKCKSLIPGDVTSPQLVSHQQYSIVKEQVPRYQQDMSASAAQDAQATYPPCSYLPEKTPAYTTQVQKVDSPVQPTPDSKVEQDGGEYPARIVEASPVRTMDEELAFLRARIMQMELEKQTIASETGKIEPQKSLEIENLDTSRTSMSEPKAETDMTTRKPLEPENSSSSQNPGSGPPQYATLISQSPPAQPQYPQSDSSSSQFSNVPQLEPVQLEQHRTLQSPPQTQQSFQPFPSQQLLQQNGEQNQQQSSVATFSPQFLPPPPTAAPQVQHLHQTSPDQVRYQQQVNTPRYAPPPPQNPAYQAAISPQYVRQDSGYYSIASPLQQPTPLFQGSSQGQSQYGVEQGQLYGRSASAISSISYPPPPSNFSPSGAQPNLVGTGYFPQVGPGNQVNNIRNPQWVVQQAGGAQFVYGQPPGSQPSMMGQQ